MKTLQASVEIEVPFHDVDAMRIVWHGYYYKYFEVARTALLRSFDYDLPEMNDSNYAWPVVESHCRYHAPLQYGAKAQVIAELLEYKHRLKIGYEIRVGSKKICKGHTIQVAFDMLKKELCLISPDILFDKLSRKLGFPISR